MGGEVDRARALVDDYWDGLIEADPLLGTLVGDERFDDRLPDPGEAGRSKREALHRSALSELEALEDRKSTRLNSSHTVISYAVFCLKKKKKKKNTTRLKPKKRNTKKTHDPT